MKKKLIELARAMDVDFRTCCAKMNRDDPWFGHLSLKTGGRVYHYRIGDSHRPDLRIIHHWHPLAASFYDAEPGDQVSLGWDSEDSAQGAMISRASITSAKRALLRIELESADLEEGAFSLYKEGETFLLAEEPRPYEMEAGGLPDIRALLTKTQYQLITSDRKNPMIIQGKAGSGKTSVALYRVSWLVSPDTEKQAPFSPERVLIVMFNRALMGFVQQSLAPLGLSSVNLDTFHGWALKQIRKAYAGEIQVDTSPHPDRQLAQSIKKKLGMLHAVERFVCSQEARMLTWLEGHLRQINALSWLEEYRNIDAPVVRRLIQLRAEARKARALSRGTPRRRLEQVHKVFQRAVKRMTQYKEELLSLLTDLDLLKSALPEIPPESLEKMAILQREVQSREASNKRRPGPYITFDDFALLLRLIELKNGGFPNKKRVHEVELYDHLVIDEAQDFGALELQVLLSAVRSRSGLTIVGDVNQKIVPDVAFMGWDALVKSLGVEGAQVTTLEVPHRSTAPIMRVADTLTDCASSTGRTGPLPGLTFVESEEERNDVIATFVRDLLGAHPLAHVCVVCRHFESVKELAESLSAKLELEARVGHNRNFSFGPGLTLTNLRQVKGLEFDAVIVADAEEERYAEGEVNRRYLYTLLTRAKEVLELVSYGPLTPLLSLAQNSALFEVRAARVEEIIFNEQDDEPF